MFYILLIKNIPKIHMWSDYGLFKISSNFTRVNTEIII